ncbi:hypothetical protein OC834_005275 [Tilletia horrida]|nr:hypothetical protein OC834_005275 [Tilletia horrida]
MQLKTTVTLFGLTCLYAASSTAAVAATAAAAVPALDPRQYYTSGDGAAGAIQVYSPTKTLTTCAATTLLWQWTGDASIADTVSIYIQNVDTSTSRRDLNERSEEEEAKERRQASLAGRMNKVRRNGSFSSSSAHHHIIQTRAGARLLASGVSLVGENWVWSSVDVSPGLYRYFVVMQGTTIYGSSTIFPVLLGSDTSCLGGGVASSSSTTSQLMTWGLAPTSSPAATTTTTALVSTPTTPALLTTASSASTSAVATPASSSTANSGVGNFTTSQSVSGDSSGTGGVHGGVIAAVVILPLAALIAIGMGVFHILKKRKEEQDGSFIRTVPSSDALNGTGGAGGGAAGWANRFLARTPSRGDMYGDETEAEAEKTGDNRASVFSDIYGGMGDTLVGDGMAAMSVSHRKMPSGDSMGRPSMADISLADAPYVHCQSITTGGRPSMTSLRSLPLSAPMPLIVEDRPTGRSYDLPRAMAAYASQTVLSPTESERAFTTGGWTQYANVGAADAAGAQPLTRAEVDTIAGSSTAAAAACGGLPPRPMPVLSRLSTIPGSVISDAQQSSADDGLSPTLMSAAEQEMPYPDTPRPYSVKNLDGVTSAGSDVSHRRPSLAAGIGLPVSSSVIGKHQRQTSAGQTFPPRSASSMSGKYPGEQGAASAYASVQRSASNGSTFAVRRKPVPAALPTAVPAPAAEVTKEAVATPASPSPFADENAVVVPGTPSSAMSFPATPRNPDAPQQNQFPETPNLTEMLTDSATSTPTAASAASQKDGAPQEAEGAAPVMDKKQYKLSVDLDVDPLRFSNF